MSEPFDWVPDAAERLTRLSTDLRLQTNEHDAAILRSDFVNFPGRDYQHADGGKVVAGTCRLPPIHLRPYIVSSELEAKMLAFANVADVLGLPAKELAARSPFGLMSHIEDGLPVAALERVAHLLAPGDAQFKYRLVPKATYDRRKVGLRLSSDEGTRVARVWGLALDVWHTEEEARDFLFRPHAMLEDRRPIDVVIQNEIGAELVLDALGSLKYGSAAQRRRSLIGR
jgi:putative toxin-antitoxin system antitoxin component (TIGR02293 family)